MVGADRTPKQHLAHVRCQPSHARACCANFSMLPKQLSLPFFNNDARLICRTLASTVPNVSFGGAVAGAGVGGAAMVVWAELDYN